MERPLNTPARDKAVHKIIAEYLKTTEKRHTPVTRIKVAKTDAGGVVVSVFTSRPSVLQAEAADLTTHLREEFGDKPVELVIVAEARAVAKFVRVSPRKARLVIEAIKGKRVSDALAMLRFIPNHASEPLSKVLASAAANAQDSWGAGPEELKIANFIADGGPSLKRLHPRAQGRAYRILKRTSHLTVVLLDAPAPVRRRPASKPAAKAVAKKAPARKKPVANATAAKSEG
jgi:large subunit ribosomal protein L22